MSKTPLVKICGLSTPASVECAIAAGADMIGLVFFPPSPRALSLAAGKTLRAQVAGRASTVALVVDMGDDALSELITEVNPDLIQLHGQETPERAQELRSRFGRPIIKAVGISGAEDLGRVSAYETLCDWLLLDAKPPKGAVLPGGNGQAFDWTLLSHFHPARPWLLSGGLNPDNVEQAIALTHAPAVDVSSGVETSPGVKDLDLIHRFIVAAKRADVPLGNRDKTA
jgi:phosphoribosylanthranilate isomerase